MKYVLVLVVVLIAFWALWGRGRKREKGKGGAAASRPADDAASSRSTSAKKGGTAPAIVACARCGLHLPQAEAVADVQERWFCDEAHRLAGPR